MRTKIISILILLLLLPCILHAQGSKKIKEQKLTAAEIKEAERIFATFKKRLEATNDLRNALRGIPEGDWFRVVTSNDREIEVLRAEKALILKHKPIFRKYYISGLSFAGSFDLYENILTAMKGSYDDPWPLLNKLPKREKKIMEELKTDGFKFTKINQVVRATNALNVTIEIVKKELSRLRIERPKDYKKGLRVSNTYTDDKPILFVAESEIDGMPKGATYMGKIEGYYQLYLARVNRRIGLLAIIIYAP